VGGLCCVGSRLFGGFGCWIFATAKPSSRSFSNNNRQIKRRYLSFYSDRYPGCIFWPRNTRSFFRQPVWQLGFRAREFAGRLLLRCCLAFVRFPLSRLPALVGVASNVATSQPTRGAHTNTNSFITSIKTTSLSLSLDYRSQVYTPG
jgi:hypothetical protein